MSEALSKKFQRSILKIPQTLVEGKDKEKFLEFDLYTWPKVW